MDRQAIQDQISKLETQVQQLQKETKYIECLDLMEEIIKLKKQIYGEESEEYNKSAQKLCELCNLIAMVFLQKEKYDVCYDFLQKAEVLCQTSFQHRAITYNNLACFYRKTEKYKQALNYLQQALNIEIKLDNSKSLADTHLNICAVLSQLNKHEEALQHVLMSITLLQEQFIEQQFLMENAEKENNEQTEQEQEAHKDRIAVLAIAIHNLAVEQEHLQRYNEAVQTYQRAVQFASENLGESHQLVVNLNEILNTASQQIEQQKLKQQKTGSGKNKQKQKNLEYQRITNVQSLYKNSNQQFFRNNNNKLDQQSKMSTNKMGNKSIQNTEFRNEQNDPKSFTKSRENDMQYTDSNQ